MQTRKEASKISAVRGRRGRLLAECGAPEKEARKKASKQTQYGARGKGQASKQMKCGSSWKGEASNQFHSALGGRGEARKQE